MSPGQSLKFPRAWTIALVIGAAIVIAPFAGWVILAIWLSGFARGLHDRLTRKLGGRDHAAALVTVGLMMMILVPLGAVVAMLVIDSIGLVTQLAESDEVHSMLVSLASDKNPNPEASVGELLMMQGERAFGIVKLVLASAAELIIGLVVLIAGTYALLIEGRRWYAWAEEHSPVGPKAVRRFSEAFIETGRGLAFGIGVAGVIQAVLATIAYLFLGVPQALPLGLLTLMFSIVPVVGTAIVWLPVSVGLALNGQHYDAMGLAAFGAIVIGSVDNLARPWLTKFGHLRLPPFLVLVSMFGAVEVFGGWGILFGPLIVRLAKEALEVRQEALA